MPRKAAGARLYWRKDKQTYIIRDSGCPERSTGTSDRIEAERLLAAYIASKDTVTGTRRADRMPISEVLDIYGREHGVTVAAPSRIGYAIDALLAFWGALSVADVKGETCRRYAKTRTRRFKDGSAQPISDGTLRRELNVLQAAINYCHKEGYLLTTTKVTLPEKPPSRDRWLTRDEAAKLIWAAWRSQRGKHLARFILLGVYTGTRKDAILNLSFMPSTVGGWIDVDRGVMYRRGADERETKKRRKPVRLTRRLLAHCRRWKDLGARWAVEIDGQRVGDIKHAFEGARERAGLAGVSPHTLKHTAITWGMQKGLPIEDAADYFDTSAETIRKVYYHHSPHYQDRAMEILERKL
ncbi:MAG: site-specific integrase [Tabrizicola sp.]|uniref:site-specific integrase n=1 Tax=Tabrizicola sp. TaxID=2005166 RepID=UPI002736D36D|nr:site-specific integrase [Tabrizicola sp.]MDP3263467.1 site-specific integrase [Tabrizicola sp.]MDP3646824.1 site-specific integrase [Paracoccaceae bacterium]MDZ4069062.1 site-specific integrase [Tabrizicola sp.]